VKVDIPRKLIVSVAIAMGLIACPQLAGAHSAATSSTLNAAVGAAATTSASGSAAKEAATSAHTFDWTWMGGSTTVNQPGVYGTLGTPATGNTPGSRQDAISWTDSDGHLWIFGGFGYDANSNWHYLNDLWEFNPSLGSYGEWAWMGGSDTVNQPGVYGRLGTPADGNIPGSRSYATGWTDSDGHLWLLGGIGYDATGHYGYLNDLWEFSPATNRWAWMGGSSTVGIEYGWPGVYGTLGAPAAGNIPGSRVEATGSADGHGHFWLFGGYGLDANNVGGLNDLWEFSPATDEWAWMSGSSDAGYIAGAYGALEIPATGNYPGSRYFATSWDDRQGNFWLFGGEGYDANGGSLVILNDLWEFNPTTSEWAWMGGSSTAGSNNGRPGVYGTLSVPSASNIPGGRQNVANATDSNGHFWLFGGLGYDATGIHGYLNDLWVFNPTTSEWAWMGGSSTVRVCEYCASGFPGVYGSLGTPAAGNIPGSRSDASSWTDGNGHFWLFGGCGIDAVGNGGTLNDLWVYQPAPVATPIFTPKAGSYPTAQTVKITDAAAGATIYYTTNGSTPTSASNLYRAPIKVTATETLEAMAEAAGYSPSAVAKAVYTIQTKPSITWTAPESIVYGTPLGSTQLDATASVGGSYVYTPKAGSVLGAGTHKLSVVFTPNDSTDYTTATASVTLSVNQAGQTISFKPLPSPVTMGVSPLKLSASASSGLAVSFSATGPAKVSGAVLTFTGLGTVAVTARQAGNGNYAAAAPVSQSIKVVKPYNLSISVTGAGSGSVTPTPTGTSCGSNCSTYPAGTAVSLAATPASGSRFAGWLGACSGSGACKLAMTANRAVTARFNLIPPSTYNLTVSTSGTGSGSVMRTPAGTSCGSNCFTYRTGTAVTLTAAPASGSRFAGWSGACSGSGVCKLAMTANRAVTARFNLIPPSTYNLTVSTSGTGSGSVTRTPAGTSCGSNCFTYRTGTAVTLTAAPASGSRFAGWSGACSGSGVCKLAMTANRAVTAKFNIAPPVAYSLTISITGKGSGTVTPTPAGASCGKNCYSYASGTVVKLTATPTGANAVFAGYSGACSGYFCTVTMSASRTVTATFAVIVPPPGKSVYEGTWIGQFSAQYRDCYWDNGSDSCNWVKGAQAFNVTIVMTTKAVNLSGQDLLNITEASASDPCFGSQVGLVATPTSPAANLPNPPGGASTFPAEIEARFPNMSNLWTDNTTGALYTSPSGNLMSNSLDPSFQPSGDPYPWLWDYDNTSNPSICSDLGPPASVIQRQYTQASWSLSKSALSANAAPGLDGAKAEDHRAR